MGVTYNGTQGSNVNSSASTTVTFAVPSVVAAGDVWMCCASFRAGSTVTISGVPGSFTLIGRVDSGSGTTNNTLVAWWYKALGTESGNFATITLSASSKSTTFTAALSGADGTSPILSGSIVTATGTTTVPSLTMHAITSGQMQFAIAGEQGVGSGAQPFFGGPANILNADTAATGTSGGSSATNVTLGGDYDVTTTDSTSWSGGQTGTGTPSTTTAIGWVVVPAAAAPAALPSPLLVVNQAINRAANWFTREDGLVVPRRRIFVPA